VAADAVRHREDEAVLVRPVADRVLVLGADAAHVGQLEELDLGHDERAGAACRRPEGGATLESYATDRVAGISFRPVRMLLSAT